MKKSIHPTVIAATGYPLFGHAYRLYLANFYTVEIVTHSIWGDGLLRIEKILTESKTAAVIVDHTFPINPQIVAEWVKAREPQTALIFVDAAPNIFRVLPYLEIGYSAYLHLCDRLDGSLRSVVDRTRRGERFLSPSVRELYERYSMYKGLFTGLPDALQAIFKLMGEGLSVEEICARTGLSKEVVYRRQFRLRERFGVESNEELGEVIMGMFDSNHAVHNAV